MRTGEILIDKLGNLINPSQSLIVSSPITGDASATLYACQITIECFNAITQQPNGLYVPNISTVVNSGLSGTLAFNIFASQYSPYAVAINPNSTIDISNTCTLQWTGVVQRITATATNVLGCNYIRILLDRN